MVRRIGLFLLAVVAILSVATMNSQAQDTLTRHMRDVTRTGEARPVGRLSANRIMQLDLVLPLRDPQGLDLLLQQLYDPNSVHYRHFLTVPEFTERFGPTQVDYDAVVSFAKRNGFAVVGGTRDGMDVQVRGPVSAVEAAFHVSMRTYQHPTGEPDFLRARPRAHHRSAVCVVARFWIGQLFDSASAVREEDRLRGGARDSVGGGCVSCHDRIGAFGFVLGQRHARGLLRRIGAHRSWAESWTA